MLWEGGNAEEEGKTWEKKLKAFWPPLQRLDGYTVRIRVPLAPRQRPRHCFCQPQQEPFKLGSHQFHLARGISGWKANNLPPPSHLYQFHIPLAFRLNLQLQPLHQATLCRNGSTTEAVRTAKVSRDFAWKLKSGGYQLRGCTVHAGHNDEEQL